METTKLKRFATEARARLRAGVATKIRSLGFDAEGNAVPGMEPTPMVGGCTWNGQILPSAFAEQWEALRRRLKAKGLKEVVEEGAYTWFNRLMAIRILSMNGIAEPVLRFVDEARTPKIVDDARQGRVITMPDQQMQRLRKLFDDPTRINEQFALLVTEYCHQTPILQACFGSLADYTELLLPNNILDKGGFIEMLNTADFISEADYKSAELIGWLYQFYISDRKDEVFAKKGKVEADEIPAATQIFTPNWIVKYMVQNAILPQTAKLRTISKLKIENRKYLIQNEKSEIENRNLDAEGDNSYFQFSNSNLKKVKDLRVADLACGSGHILNECFDLLYDLYIASGFGRGEAIESIFANNLLGIDIDERARQLATFALMLKACQRDDSFAEARALPQVLSMPEVNEAQVEEFFRLSDISGEALKELREAFDLMKDADSLGSIMKFDISGSTRVLLQQTLSHWINQSDKPEAVIAAIPAVRLILALTDSYDAIVMNPPYMPTSRVDALKSYTAKNYPDSKADLFSVFMDVCIDRLKDGGKYGMINMQSWMFLSSFETLRKKILDTQHIDSLLHLGPRTFDELSGEVVQNSVFVISRWEEGRPRPSNSDVDTEVRGRTSSQYFRLVDGKSCAAKRDMYLANENHYTVADQKQFEQIPGAPIAYWISKPIIDSFSHNSVSSVLQTREGMATADNDRFLRLWHEINKHLFTKVSDKGFKWYPYNKGGQYRKWYGNRDYVVNWENDGFEIKNNIDPITRRIRSHNYNGEFGLRECATWTAISSDGMSMRYCDEGFLWDSKGASGFANSNLKYIIGLLNSKVTLEYLKFLSPTLEIKVGHISKVPYIERNVVAVSNIVSDSIGISLSDWDAHETSWDFQCNELVAISKSEIENRNSIEAAVEAYERKWTDLFLRLHANEEELNRQFIEIYGLQDELSPDVPLNEVTILQQGEVSWEEARPRASFTAEDDKYIVDDKGRYLTVTGDKYLEWQRDVIIKQLISYMVGVWMGRYRLDRPGLNIAHPNPTEEELASYKYGPDNAILTIDDDGIIPILPTGAPFDDNLSKYIADFVRIAWGEESQTDNLNFIEQCLGKKIEDYVQKDFWKDHKKMYQNRPIYWLFASKKGAFKALVYVHRMHPYTVEQVRTRYLLKYMDWLRSEAQRLEIRDADLTTAERRRLDRLRSDIEECEEYHERLQVVAEQAIPIDLDNGIPANHALFGDIVTKLK